MRICLCVVLTAFTWNELLLTLAYLQACIFRVFCMFINQILKKICEQS